MPDDLRKLALLVKREIILENPNVLFKDIVSLDTSKQIFQELFLEIENFNVYENQKFFKIIEINNYLIATFLFIKLLFMIQI